MKISNRAIYPLGTLIAGDTRTAPYLSGSQLVDFYNECGFNDEYGPGFPSRWKYSSDKISQSNGTDILRKILEEFVDPRRYNGDETIVDSIVYEVNQLIKYDGFVLTKRGNFYRVSDIQGNFINSESLTNINHEFVSEHIKKCQQKISFSDFNGAITNARTLVETVLIYIIESIERIEVENSGDLTDLWKRVKKSLKISEDKISMPEYVFQILTGITSTLNGIAAFSNNAGDRHANKFGTKRHHAKLAVNMAMTICDFLIDLLNESKENK